MTNRTNNSVADNRAGLAAFYVDAGTWGRVATLLKIPKPTLPRYLDGRSTPHEGTTVMLAARLAAVGYSPDSERVRGRSAADVLAVLATRRELAAKARSTSAKPERAARRRAARRREVAA